ncbi:hypothetical protein ZWY2020_025634 [Hordeum vulgare]|nr:hypothetical protein ZWY2020_025634 [Hordeum vulgare]
MAVFRVTGRAHDPADIRRAATLEIIEQLPGRTPSEAPGIHTLTFPVSIALTKAELIRAAPAIAQDAAGSAGDGEDAVAKAAGMAPAMSTATVLVRGLGALADVAANAVVRPTHRTGGPMVWQWTRSRRSRTHEAAPAVQTAPAWWLPGRTRRHARRCPAVAS